MTRRLIRPPLALLSGIALALPAIFFPSAQAAGPSFTISSPAEDATVAGVIVVRGTATPGEYCSLHVGYATIIDPLGNRWVPFWFREIPGTGTYSWEVSLDTRRFFNGVHEIFVSVESMCGDPVHGSRWVVFDNPLELRAEDLWIEQKGRDAAGVDVVVSNPGPTPVGPFFISLALDYAGERHPVGRIFSTGMTGSHSGNLHTEIRGGNFRFGTFDIVAYVDAEGAVAEVDETNNEVSGTIWFWTDAIEGQDVRNPRPPVPPVDRPASEVRT